VLHLRDALQHVFEVTDIAAGKIDGGAFGRESSGEQHAAVFYWCQLRLEAPKQEIGCAGRGNRGHDHEGSDAQACSKQSAVAVGEGDKGPFKKIVQASVLLVAAQHP